MRIAALADCHLGFRAGYRCTPTGINQREADCANAFRFAVDGILTAKPDLVCIAGDLFDSPRPSNAAIMFAFDQLKRLRDAGLPVVLAAGNHDKNRTVETGCILHLFKQLGVQLAIDGPQTFAYPALDLSVTAVPDRSDLEGITPGEAKYRVLCIHGALEGHCPNVPGTIPRALVEDERWSWVCLGDFHEMKQVAERAWYSGSLEFCSSNIWSEVGTPKGWLLITLPEGTVAPQLVPTREVLDLGSFDATGMTPPEVNAALAERLSDISGKLVRLKCLNIPSAILRQLDHRQVKRWQADALSLKLDFLRPERVRREQQQGANRQTLNDIVAAFLGRYEFSPGINRERVAALGQEIMGEAQEVEQEKMAKRGAA